MMKHLLLFAICGALLTSSSTVILKEDIPLASSMSYVYESNVPVEQKMLNAKTWIAKNFGDYKSVLQYEDSENHRIIIKGHATVSTEVHGDALGKHTAYFTSTYDFKEDRYRIKYEDIRIVKTVSYHGNDLDIDVELDDFFSTARTDRYIEEQKAKLEELQQKSQLKLSRKEREQLDTEILETKNTIYKQEVYRDGEGRQNAEQNISDFQLTFWGLLLSASSAIETVDDF